jgi:hypothetical protein
MQHTIDSLIALLEQQKAEGVPGDTPVVVEARDNNGRYGFAQRVTTVRTVAVAKSDFEKGWELCKVVSNRGVQTVLIG